jgi:hypothetical protein
MGDYGIAIANARAGVLLFSDDFQEMFLDIELIYRAFQGFQTSDEFRKFFMSLQFVRYSRAPSVHRAVRIARRS